MLPEFEGDTRVVHCNKELYDIYIGRPSIWGNPFTHIKDKTTKAQFIVKSREEAIQKYREWIVTQPELMQQIESLRGKVLGCWCKKLPCHGDVLVEILNLQAELGYTQISTLIKIYRSKYIDNDTYKRSQDSSSQSSSEILF